MKTGFSLKVRACAVLAVAAGIWGPLPTRAQSGAPQYHVDVTWPKPLPDRWVI